MIPIVVLAPLFHGPLGLLDELELFLTPIVIVITVLVYRFLSWRAARRSDRSVDRHRVRRTDKNG
jgi:hypothetical protein